MQLSKLRKKRVGELLLAMAALAIVGSFAARSMGPSREVRRWAQRLAKGDVPARREAAAELITPKPRDMDLAAEALIAALDDPDDQVRALSASALGSLASPGRVAATEAAKTSPMLPEGSLRTRVVARLVDALEDPAPAVRARAAEAVGGLGELPRPSVARLASTLRLDPSPAVRLAAARALKRADIEDREAIDTLIAAVRDDKDAVVRAASAESLAPIAGYEPVFLALIAAFLDADLLVRDAAVLGLKAVKIPPLSGIPGLIALVELSGFEREDEWFAHLVPLDLLESIGPEAAQAAPALLKAYRRADVAYRAKKVPPGLDSVPSSEARALYAVAPDSPEFREVLADLIEILAVEPASWRQYSAANVLGTFGKAAEPALPTLRTAAVVWDPENAGSAGRAINAIELAIEGVEP